MKELFDSGGCLHWVKNLYKRWKYGGGCCDVFGLDYYLAKKIIKPLRAFRNYDRMSHPAEFKSSEEWQRALDEMVWAFEYLLSGEGIDDDFDFKKLQEDSEREQKGFELFGKYFRNLWI